MAPPVRPKRPIALASLRGFEASARLLSFTLAAEELFLTQSSISRQIKTLEEQVGKPLFRRRTRQLELTAAGARLHRTVQTSLNEVDRAVAEIRRTTQRKRITLTTFASFASLMLVPRLAQFSALYPDIDIRIDAVDETRDLEAENIDVAIRHSRPQDAPQGAIKLQDDHMIPVMSPALLARGKPIQKPDDLARYALIFQDFDSIYGELQGWPRWFSELGEPMPDESPSLSFNFTYQALDAAIQGQGIMLAPLIYIRERLRRGELVCPIPVRLATPFAYYLLRNRDTGRSPHVAAFANWVVEELRLRAEDELRIGDRIIGA